MPLYAHSCEEHGEFEAFRHMRDSGNDAPCPKCGAMCAKLITMPRVSVKAARENPNDSVKRITGVKRKHFDCPWPNAQTGKCERVYLKGSKAEQKAQVQDAVLRSKYAARHNLKRADVNPSNL